MVNECDPYRRETLARSAQNIPISTCDHEGMVNAAAAGDERLAERFLFEHEIESRERLPRALANLPAPPAQRARAA